MKKYTFILCAFLIFFVFYCLFVLANPIHVKDYIADKFSTTFILYLSSLEELDEAEKEFIDLLEQLAPEEQTLYAKRVYKEGFNSQMITEIKEFLQKEDSKHSEEYVLDAFYWGMNREEAEQLLQGKEYKTTRIIHSGKTSVNGEKKDYTINLDGFYYQGKVSQIDMRILLKFYEDRLVGVSFILPDDIYDNLNNYIISYEKLKKDLVEKHHKPHDERIVWSNDRYKNTPEKWGLAIKKGELFYISRWDTPKTTIELGLMGRKNKIHFFYSCESKEYEEIEKGLIESFK